MIRTVTNPRLRTALTAVVILSLIGIVGASTAFVTTQSRSSSQINFTNQAEAFLSTLKDLETGYRGYVITGSEDFLSPYQAAVAQLGTDKTNLKNAAQNAGVTEKDLQPLYDFANAKLAFANSIVAARQSSFEAAQALVATRTGKAQMDNARATVESLIQQSNFELTRYSNNMRRIFVPVGAISIMVLAIASGLLLYLANRARLLTTRSRSLLSDVIERAPVGLALIDKSMNIDQMNLTFGRMTGGAAQKFTGQPLSAITVELAEKLRSRIEDALQGRRGWKDSADDLIIELPVGVSTRYLKADVFPVKLVSESGTDNSGAGIVLNDFTKQREWEMELEEAKATAESANRAKSAFLANMSHELRTPLTAVLGYTELIEDDLRDQGSTEVLADLNKITINARHLLQLINDVLDLSKIEAQKMDVHAIDFTLKALFTELEAATGSLVAKNDNSLVFVSDNPDTVLHTDDLKVKQILLNIIGNAAKFTSNGKIEVKAEQIDVGGTPHTRFTVSDNGIGMSKEQLANLFQRFTQADETTTRKYGGTGLGLALTRALSRMLGGNIEVASEAGKGTTFTITIPSHFSKPEAQIEMGAVSQQLESRPSEAPGSTAATVLVVDDEPAAREVLQRHLTREGFAVQSASNGAEALAMIEARPPIAVLLDVMMPGLDGWHVLKAIRGNPKTASIPVVITTVLDEQNFAYAMGATGYLKKPVRRPELAEALQVAATSGEHKILIVDDDADASARLKGILNRDGWDVSLALNGAEALQRMAENRPSLVLVDLIMPEMDGYAFIREVRRRPEFNEIPLLVMTAEDINSGKVRQLRPHTAGIVQKGAMPMADLVADLRRFAQSPNGTNGSGE